MLRLMRRLGLVALLSGMNLTLLVAQDAAISGKVVSPKPFGSIPASIFVLRCADRDCLVQEPERFLHVGADAVFDVGGLEPASYMVLAYRRGLTPWLTEAFSLEPGQRVDLEVAMTPVAKDPEIRYPEATAHDLEQFEPTLAAMAEPPFCASRGDSSGESYRFLWLRSFHHPILISVRIQDGTASAVYKELDGQGPDDTSRLVADERIDVNARLNKTDEDPESARRILRYVSDESEDSFWRLPFDVASSAVRLDGATWTVEGRRAGKCHVVTRWSPGLKSPLRQFVETLIGLSGKRFYYDEYY